MYIDSVDPSGGRFVLTESRSDASSAEWLRNSGHGAHAIRTATQQHKGWEGDFSNMFAAC